MNSQTDLVPTPASAPATSGATESDSQHAQFVDWMRSVAPYIHAFRNKTFVVGFGGEVVHQGLLNALVSDIALMQAMGIQIVLVHGSRPQVEEQMSLHGVESEFSHGMRITDARALESAKEAAGDNSVRSVRALLPPICRIPRPPDTPFRRRGNPGIGTFARQSRG